MAGGGERGSGGGDSGLGGEHNGLPKSGASGTCIGTVLEVSCRSPPCNNVSVIGVISFKIRNLGEFRQKTAELLNLQKSISAEMNNPCPPRDNEDVREKNSLTW